MSADNKTAIDLINEISQAINGKDASINSRPTPAEIITALNDSQNNICRDKQEYSFLRKVGIVQAWELGVGSVAGILGGGAGNKTATAYTAGGGGPSIQCVAEKYICPADTVQVIDQVMVTIFPQIIGVGQLNGTFQAQIVGVTGSNKTLKNYNPALPAGVPDMQTILATSSPIVIQNNVITGRPAFITGSQPTLTFTFDDSVAICNGQQVFVVFEWLPTAYNSASFNWAQYSNVVSKTSFGPWSNTNYPTIPILSGVFGFLLTIKNAVYKTTITMPSDCRYVNRIFSLAQNLTLTSYPYDVIQYRPIAIPQNVFSISGQDSNGNLTVNIYTTLTNVLFWYVEYMARPVAFVNDTDISIIPRDFRDILKWNAIMNLAAGNYGIQLDKDHYETLFMAGLNKLNENFLPQEDIAMSVVKGGITEVNAPIRDFISQNILVYEYPNVWQSNQLGTGRVGGGE